MEPSVHYRVQNRADFPILTNMNQIYALPSYTFKAHFNTVLPFMLSSSKRALSFGFSYQKF